MKTNSLTVYIPNYGNDRNYRYDTNKIAYSVVFDPELIERNIHKVTKIVEQNNINYIFLTSNGEPFFNESSREWLYKFCRIFRDYPLEVQTNGIYIRKNIKKADAFLPQLYLFGLNTITIPINKLSDINITSRIARYEFNIKIVLNITDMILPKKIKLSDIIDLCLKYKIKQLSIRNVAHPSMLFCDFGLITKNKNTKLYQNLCSEILLFGTKIRESCFGFTIYNIKDISVDCFDYNILDDSELNNEHTYNIIFREDGHLYTNWNTPASIVF